MEYFSIYYACSCGAFNPFLLFFVIYRGRLNLRDKEAYLTLATAFESLHSCFKRSVKYTFFDATKELAFIPLDHEGQVKGKLIIDGIGSGLGRGISSFLSIILYFIMRALGESTIFTGILALSFLLFLFLLQNT